jgi:hypothetical protein
MIFGVLATDARLYGAFAARSKCRHVCGLRHNENVQSLIGQGKLIPNNGVEQPSANSGEDG